MLLNFNESDEWKDKNKEFWMKQAKDYQSNPKAVNFDPLMEDLEIQFLQQFIDENEIVLDFGCGNGKTTIELALKKRTALFYGIDYVEEMIEVANEQKKQAGVSNIIFFVADSTSQNINTMFNFKFDKVISKRLLINLKGESKNKAVENIHAVLKEKGKYIMVECFLEPLNRINEIRKLLNMEEIKVKDFNEYLKLDFFEEIRSLFTITKKVDFGSLYYFTSRIYNAYLSQGKPDYHAPINNLALQLSKVGVQPLDGYSPEIIYILEKV